MKTNLFKTIFLLAIFFALPNFVRAAEDLSRITGSGGTVYFAHDFESGIYAADAGSGNLSWVGGNPNNPIGNGCQVPDDDSIHNSYISSVLPAQNAVAASTKSLITPYLGVCPTQSFQRDTTTINLQTPIPEYYARWYQKWTGSFQETVQQKFTKFYYADNENGTINTLTAHFSFGGGIGSTSPMLTNHMANIDGRFNKNGVTFAEYVWVASTWATRSPHYNGQTYGQDDYLNTLNAGSDGEIYFQLDRWYSMEIHSKLNSFDGANYLADGMVELWIDGAKVFEVANVKLRDGLINRMPGTDTFEFQHIYYNRSDQDQSTFMDNIVIADKYIGPLSSSDVIAPTAPTNLNII